MRKGPFLLFWAWCGKVGEVCIRECPSVSALTRQQVLCPLEILLSQHRIVLVTFSRGMHLAFCRSERKQLPNSIVVATYLIYLYIKAKGYKTLHIQVSQVRSGHDFFQKRTITVVVLVGGKFLVTKETTYRFEKSACHCNKSGLRQLSE